MTDAEEDYQGMREFQRKFIEKDQQYRELVDALCSESWGGRNHHDLVVKLARKLKDSQVKLHGH